MAVNRVSLEEITTGSTSMSPCVVALGTFDGVHRGHVAILSKAHELAHSLGAKSIVFTFDRQPLEFLRPNQAPPLISTHESRVALLSNYVDEVIVTPFGSQLANMEPDNFVQRVLKQGLGCIGITAGFNYTFGKGAQGHAANLAALGATYNLEVAIVPPVVYEGRQISSTLIRQLIQKGDVTTAMDLLGRPFRLEGQVINGDARGRVLGFPTANLASDKRLLIPGEGVYVTELWIDNKDGSQEQKLGIAVTAVSKRPTFDGQGTSVESFVLDYQGDLYGAKISLFFMRRLRDIQKFDGPEALTNQIEADVMAARQHFPLPRLQV